MRMLISCDSVRPGRVVLGRRAGWRASVVFLGCVIAAVSQEALAIGFVQVNSAVPQTPQSTVSVAYTGAQAAGDLNVVVVGWNDTTASITAVTDSRGNPYQLAVGPTKYSGLISQSIYYAPNIVSAAAGANTITVTFSTAAHFPDIRIAEYSGLAAANTFDVGTAAIGSGTTANSGLATTTGGTDLLVSADMTTTGTANNGTGYTLRVLTSPDGDVVQDTTASAGNYQATATITPSGTWIMQLAAFKGVTSTAQPTPPTNLAGVANGAQISLTWTAATDTAGTITSYQILRCKGVGCVLFATIGSIAPATHYNDTTIQDSSSYTYRINATDSLGHTSSYSNAVTVTTSSNCCDSTPPTAPTNLTAIAASSGQINLTWTAATDNVGVTAYQVQRCQGSGCSTFATVGQIPPQTSYSDSGLSASTSYTYHVRALDNAGNQSAASNNATTTTLSGGGGDTQPPTTPSALTATASGNQINLAWIGSTDNVGVAGYQIQRCTGAGCSTFAILTSTSGPGTTYGDASTVSSTTYSYRLSAFDAAGNFSGYTNTASATTGSASGAQTTYSYDAHGRLQSATSGASTTQYSYDAAGHLTGIQTH
jgi:YD repeat-containing protein